MIQEQIQSLAVTPDPIVLENLPPEQIYILIDALSWIERYWRMDAGVPYPPLNPEPYAIPREIEERLEMSIKILPLEEFKNRVKVFLKRLRKIKPIKGDLLYNLATALDPWTPINPHENPGPQRAVEIPKTNPTLKRTDYALDKPKFVNPVLSTPTRLADKWKLNSRWEKLTPCAIACEYALLRRAYRKETFEKITRALSEGRTWYPWVKKGIRFLSSKLEYTKRSNPKVKHYEDRQIRRGLKQLDALGLISIFYRGYKDQGAGKCFVFLNPEMSSSFHRRSRLHKKGSTPRK